MPSALASNSYSLTINFWVQDSLNTVAMKLTLISLFVGLCGAATIAKSVADPQVQAPAAPSSPAPNASSPLPTQGNSAMQASQTPQAYQAPQASQAARASQAPQINSIVAPQASAILQASVVAPAQAASPLPQAPSQVVPIPATAQGGTNPASQGGSSPQAQGMPLPAPAQGGIVPAPKASAAAPARGSPAAPQSNPKTKPEPKESGNPAPKVVIIPEPKSSPRPASNQPSVVSCAPEQPAYKQENRQIVGQIAPSGSTGTKNQQSFVFWSNAPLKGEDMVMDTVVGAIKSSGGVIKSNLNIKSTTFRYVASSTSRLVVLVIESLRLMLTLT